MPAPASGSLSGAGAVGSARGDRRLVRWLVVAVAALVVALAGLGSWVVWDRVSTGDGGALVDHLTTAWSAYDADALRTLYAPDAVVRSGAMELDGIDEILRFATRFEQLGGSVESVGDVIVRGDTVTTWVRWGDGSEHLPVLELENGVIVRQHDFSAGVYWADPAA
jgi:hypothetical protein